MVEWSEEVRSAVPVIVGLGSNLGDRVSTLLSARRGLERLSSEPVFASSLYETAPIGPEQPDFLNAACLVRSDLPLGDLLTEFQALESQYGRLRAERFGPRTLDLDILYVPGVISDDPRLLVPHPRLSERAFALFPLLELAPDACDPRTKRAYNEIAEELQGQRIQQFLDDRWIKTLPVQMGARLSGQG